MLVRLPVWKSFFCRGTRVTNGLIVSLFGIHFAQLFREFRDDFTIMTTRWPASDRGPTPIFDHRVPLVQCPGTSRRSLVDVAAGRTSLSCPLRLELHVQQFLPGPGVGFRIEQDCNYLRPSSLVPR